MMDVFGQALHDTYYHSEAETLWLHNSYGEPEEMPIEFFFRDDEDMPLLELQALHQCKGKILDIGAGVGSHALLLQAFNCDVTAIDISDMAVDIMQHRGVKKTFKQNIFTYQEKFDTLLLLMNGIGLSGDLAGFKALLSHFKSLVLPGGQVLFDTSDIAYLYRDTPRPQNQYYGEVAYQYEYKGKKGNWFKWIYLDEQTIKQVAAETGWHAEIIFDDGEDQFLVRLS